MTRDWLAEAFDAIAYHLAGYLAVVRAALAAWVAQRWDTAALRWKAVSIRG